MKKICTQYKYSKSMNSLLESKIYSCTQVQKTQSWKIMDFVNEINDWNEYFLDFKEGQYQEMELIWIILSTIRPEEKINKNLWKWSIIKPEGNEDDLIEINPEIFEEKQFVIS